MSARAKPVLPLVERQDHYGRKVWTNVAMDILRRGQCLCLNCRTPDCLIAEHLFNLCKMEGIAFAMTRCPIWTPKERNDATD